MSERGVKRCTSADHVEGGGAIPARSLHFLCGMNEDAIELVKRFHYSHRAPSNIQFIGSLHREGGLFGDCGECVAAAFFCIPPTRWKEPVLELARLVRTDNYKPPLAFLISMCCKKLRQHGHDLLVSFADNTQGHKGYVYRASNWNYHGKRARNMDGLVINGEFVPGRTCNSIYTTRSPSKLKAMKPDWDIQPHYDKGKFLYWKALGKRGEKKAKRLGLEKNKWRIK
jgi:hypothetical protein